MISPTMMMETEEESDTSEDTIEDKSHEEKHNIYEEVLNNEPSPCWMVTSPGTAGKKVSVEKQRLSRTSKSVHGHHPCNHSYIQRTHTTTDYFLPPTQKKHLSKKGTLSEKFSYLGYSVFGK